MAEEILTHTHEVIDTDREFYIDPLTKKISAGSSNLTLAQHSKNAERLTFCIPDKTIEGHDMAECNQVMIHFRNIAQDTLATNAGVYKATDLTVGEDGTVKLSWLVDDDATQYAGGLIFSIHFMCVADDGTVLYDLPTLSFAGISIGETVWNSAVIAQQYPDIIAKLEARVSSLEDAEAASAAEALSATISQAEDGTVTITMPMSDGTTSVCVLTPGDDGFPVMATIDGVEKPITWEGW